jgi:hypothetical protein
VKIVVKKILSGLSTSSGFYQAIEKSYNFISVNRFKEVSRLRLDALYKQICVDANQHNFDLVRVGSAHDGGYVMMNPKSRSCNVISLGIADNMDFELELIEKKLVSAIFCFDGSIEKLPSENDSIYFESKYIKVSKSENSLNLSQVLAKIDSDELILKIDIEGDEWDVLGSLSESELRRFSQIIGEFHGFASNLTDEGILKMTSLLQRISGQFHLVNSHPNNWSQYRIIQGIPIPDVIEFTFIHRSLASENLRDEYSKDSKSQLNSPCNPDKSEYLF